jgi:hypothetical protein
VVLAEGTGVSVNAEGEGWVIGGRHVHTGRHRGEGAQDVVVHVMAGHQGLADAGFKHMEASDGALQEGVEVHVILPGRVGGGKESNTFVSLQMISSATMFANPTMRCSLSTRLGSMWSYLFCSFKNYMVKHYLCF